MFPSTSNPSSFFFVSSSCNLSVVACPSPASWPVLCEPQLPCDLFQQQVVNVHMWRYVCAAVLGQITIHQLTYVPGQRLAPAPPNDVWSLRYVPLPSQLRCMWTNAWRHRTRTMYRNRLCNRWWPYIFQITIVSLAWRMCTCYRSRLRRQWTHALPLRLQRLCSWPGWYPLSNAQTPSFRIIVYPPQYS